MRASNPIVWLLGSLLIFGAGLSLQPYASSRIDAVGSATSAYTTRLSDTHRQLSSLLYDLSASPLLKQNIDWHLQHSLQKNLEAQLRPGELDDLRLISTDCTTLAKAHVVSQVGDFCPDARKGGPYFQWLDSKTPTLGLSVPLSNKLWLAGFVQLNQSWLSLSPAFAKLLKEANLTIASVKTTKDAIFPAGRRNDSRFSASLVARSGLDAWLYAHAPFNYNEAAWLLLLLGLTASLLAWLNHRQQLGRSKKTVLKASEDLQALIPASQQTGSELEISSVADRMDAYLAGLKKTLEDQQGKIADLHAQLSEKEVEISSLSQQGVTMAGFESLAAQMRATSKPFLDQLNELEGRLQDLSDTLTHGLNRNAQTFHAVIKTWQSEAEQRGVRRFLRSLSEKQGQRHADLLTEQFTTLVSMSEAISSTAINMSIQTQDISHKFLTMRKQTEHWRSMALKTEAQDICTSLLDSVLEAQRMTQLDSQANVQFFNPLDFVANSGLPAAPKSTWTSIIFHIYKVLLAEVNAGEEIQIRSQIKVLSAKTAALVVSTLAETSHHSATPLTNDQMFNLQLAEKLAEPYGILCTKLPNIRGPLALSMQWHSTTPMLTPSNRREGASAIATM